MEFHLLLQIAVEFGGECTDLSLVAGSDLLPSFLLLFYLLLIFLYQSLLPFLMGEIEPRHMIVHLLQVLMLVRWRLHALPRQIRRRRKAALLHRFELGLSKSRADGVQRGSLPETGGRSVAILTLVAHA